MPRARPSNLGCYAVAIQRDVVVLDLAREAYLCLPDAISSPDEAGDLATCLAAARLPNRPTALPYAELPAPPMADLEDAAEGAFEVRDLLDAAIATVDVLINYRGRNLSGLLQLVSGQKPRPAVSPSPDPIGLARRWRRWMVLCPVPPKCLVRSFILVRYLQRHGAAATWVLGVRTWPFRAHCWVQAGPVALDDAHDKLVAYTPICAVRG